MPMTIHEFLSRFDRTTPAGGQCKVKCPAHDDKTASLAVKEGDDGKIVLFCHAGCSTDRILAAMNLTNRDLFTESGSSAKREAAIYSYKDEHGELLYEVV